MPDGAALALVGGIAIAFVIRVTICKPAGAALEASRAGEARALAGVRLVLAVRRTGDGRATSVAVMIGRTYVSHGMGDVPHACRTEIASVAAAGEDGGTCVLAVLPSRAVETVSECGAAC